MSKDVSIPTFTIQYLMESGQGLTSNLDEKIPRLILNEMVTGAESYVKMDSPQMSQPPERSSE